MRFRTKRVTAGLHYTVDNNELSQTEQYNISFITYCQIFGLD